MICDGISKNSIQIRPSCCVITEALFQNADSAVCESGAIILEVLVRLVGVVYFKLSGMDAVHVVEMRILGYDSKKSIEKRLLVLDIWVCFRDGVDSFADIERTRSLSANR